MTPFREGAAAIAVAAARKAKRQIVCIPCAIKYRYASMAGRRADTFQRLYMQGRLSAEQEERILRTVFVEQLGRLYAAANREPKDLLDYYEFAPRWADSVRSKVFALVGNAAHEPRLRFPGGREASNICGFYEDTLPNLPDYRFFTDNRRGRPQ